jgi:hypothetical protein
MAKLSLRKKAKENQEILQPLQSLLEAQGQMSQG